MKELLKPFSSFQEFTEKKSIFHKLIFRFINNQINQWLWVKPLPCLYRSSYKPLMVPLILFTMSHGLRKFSPPFMQIRIFFRTFGVLAIVWQRTITCTSPSTATSILAQLKLATVNLFTTFLFELLIIESLLAPECKPIMNENVMTSRFGYCITNKMAQRVNLETDQSRRSTSSPVTFEDVDHWLAWERIIVTVKCILSPKRNDDNYFYFLLVYSVHAHSQNRKPFVRFQRQSSAIKNLTADLTVLSFKLGVVEEWFLKLENCLSKFWQCWSDLFF